jgi:hypothetical protein
LYPNAQELYVYDNGALDRAAREGYGIWMLDTGMGADSMRGHMHREMTRIKGLGVHVEVSDYKEFLNMSSMDCLDAMCAMYNNLGLEWNIEWHLWQSAYWNLINIPEVVHGKKFGIPRSV